MSAFVSDNGTLRRITSAFVNDAGVLRRLHTAAVSDNGTLRLVRISGVINEALPDSINQFSTEWELGNDGIYSVGDGAAGALTGDWVTPSNSDIAAQFEVFATLVSGTVESGTFGSWLSLATTRTWVKTSAGAATVQFQFRIGSEIVNTQSVNLTVT